jgi:hypothetical protein
MLCTVDYYPVALATTGASKCGTATDIEYTCQKAVETLANPIIYATSAKNSVITGTAFNLAG